MSINTSINTSINNSKNHYENQVSSKVKNGVEQIINELSESLYNSLYSIACDIDSGRSYEDIINTVYNTPESEIKTELESIKSFLYKKAVELEHNLKVKD